MTGSGFCLIRPVGGRVRSGGRPRPHGRGSWRSAAPFAWRVSSLFSSRFSSEIGDWTGGVVSRTTGRDWRMERVRRGDDDRERGGGVIGTCWCNRKCRWWFILYLLLYILFNKGVHFICARVLGGITSIYSIHRFNNINNDLTNGRPACSKDHNGRNQRNVVVLRTGYINGTVTLEC